MEKLFGLIGYPLSHSFSKRYFTEKFGQLNLHDHRYELFEIKEISAIKKVLAEHPNLVGLNVTIPYKEAIIPYLVNLDQSAERVGAVNVIKIAENILTGYNSDYFGFEQSLLSWLPENIKLSALVLGTGGASKAVKAVLGANNIEYKLVSRTKSELSLSYEDLKNSLLVSSHKLIVNTTPLGMSPNLNDCPDIPFNQLTKSHFVYDLIYNPEQTKFLKKAQDIGAATKNGLAMLKLQAEKSWEIWSS